MLQVIQYQKTGEISVDELPAPKLRPEDVRATVVLVVDDLGLSFESMAYVRRALRKFIEVQMQPGDLVAICRTSYGSSALNQFTNDKRRMGEFANSRWVAALAWFTAAVIVALNALLIVLIARGKS